MLPFVEIPIRQPPARSARAVASCVWVSGTGNSSAIEWSRSSVIEPWVADGHASQGLDIAPRRELRQNADVSHETSTSTRDTSLA